MKKSLFVAAVLVVALVGGPAQADTASGGQIKLAGATDYDTRIGTLSLFNPNAGTLTGVSLSVSYGFSAGVMVSAQTQSSGRAFAQSAASFSSSNGAINAIFNAVVNTRPNASFGSSTLDHTAYDLTGTASAYNLNAGESATFSSVASASNTYLVNASDLAAFYANSSAFAFDVYGKTLTGLNLAVSSGNAVATQQTTATQSISVLYTYTPFGAETPAVPEPATWATMLLGFAMVAGFARRRRHTSTVAFG